MLLVAYVTQHALHANGHRDAWRRGNARRQRIGMARMIPAPWYTLVQMFVQCRCKILVRSIMRVNVCRL